MSAIPEGWKLVPIEPTLDMCLAGASARIAIETPTPAEAAYKSMLAAAQQPPVSHAKPEKQAEPNNGGPCVSHEVDEAQLQRLRENGAKAWAFLGDRSASDWVEELRGNAPETREHCTWTQVDDEHTPDTWQGSCGAVWSFIDGGPADNGQRFCPKCGGECKEVRGAA